MKTFLKVAVGVLLAAGLFAFAFYRTPQERAFKKNFISARNGDAKAALEVARAYLKGEGTKKDIKQSLEFYQQAAASGDAVANWELAHYYISGEGTAQDKEMVVTYLQVAAHADHAQAQYELGNLYARGEGVPQQEEQALFWYIKATKNGSAQAQAKVTSLLTEKPELVAGVTKFMENLEAAQKQDPQAMLEVAKAYRSGQFAPRDDEAAFKWFNKAWEGTDPKPVEAALALAEQYSLGEGVEKREEKALEMLAGAAELKNPVAQFKLGEMAYTENPPRLEDAFAWFSNAAAQGHVRAQYMTGFMLLQGQGTAKSVPLAIEFFEQAANQNDSDAQYVLGQIFLKGIGVKKNRIRGRAWLKLAAQNGSEDAQKLLEN